MTRMIWKATGIIMSVLLVFSVLSGCKSSEDGEGGETKKTTAKPLKMEQIAVWSTAAHEKDLRLKQIEKYNNNEGKEKGIIIKQTVYGNEYKDTVKIAGAADQLPHIFTSPSVLEDFAEAGWAIPFTELPGMKEWLDEEYEGKLVKNEHIINGKVYSAPLCVSTFRFVINRDLFKKAGIESPPKTWDEVREYAKKITESSGGKQFGYGLSLQSSWTQSVYGLTPFMFSTGHRGFDFSEKKFKYIDFKPFYDVIMGMKEDGSIFPGAEGLDADRLRAQFSEGNIGMLPMPYWDVGVYTNQFPAKIEWEVVPMPRLSLETSHDFDDVTQAEAHFCISPTALNAPEKTFEVIKFYYSDKVMAEMYMEGKYIPLHDVSEHLIAEPEIKGWSAFKPLEKPLLMPADITSALRPEGDDVNTTLTKMLAGSKKDVEKTLLDMDRRFNAALEKEIEKGLNVDDFIIK